MVRLVFSAVLHNAGAMEKQDHGARLKSAMGARRLNRQTVADAVGVQPRTVTNWTSGTTMPTEAEKATLRRLLGDYDDPGDGVEVAIRASELQPWRQAALVAEYQRHLHEQQREAAG
jgi:transcriptional regulator with XRE-family HTH domain